MTPIHKVAEIPSYRLCTQTEQSWLFFSPGLPYHLAVNSNIKE